jgi:hypothetical protein
MKLENIYIESNDDVSAVVERVLNAQSDNVVLFVPEQAKISESILNLRLLYREAKAAGKNIFLDTDEEEVKTMAEEVGIPVVERQESVKPISRGPSFIRDIAPPASKKKIPGMPKIEIGHDEEINRALKARKSRYWSAEAAGQEDFAPAPKTRRRLKMPKSILLIFLGIVILAALGGGGLYFFSRAEIRIITQKTTWQNQSAVLALKNLDKTDLENFKIEAGDLKLSRQVVKDFPATGLKDVKVKSSGKITVFNAYSSTPQTLIANTRFLSQDGKLFRLSSALIVPGAKVEAGKIIPSSIDANVVADQSGEEYNIGSSHFTIPGFKGTSKYDKFYAESSEAMKGGYIGQAKIISQEDLDKAKSQLTELAQISLDEELQVSLLDEAFQRKFSNFKILNEAKAFMVEKTSFSNQAGDQVDSFRGNLTASLKVLIFSESDVKDIFVYNAQQSPSPLSQKDLFGGDFQYGTPRVDFEKGMLSFPVNATLVFRDKISTDELPNELVRMNESQLQKFFSALPWVEKVSVKIKPGFLNFLPFNAHNIKIILDATSD